MSRRTKERKAWDAEHDRLLQIREEKGKVYQQELDKNKPANKYMRGDGSVDPDELTADDLINTANALDILNKIDYKPTAISQADLEAAMDARGLFPSDIVRLSSVQPGQLQKRQYLYDVAAQKISERMARIKENIATEGLTERNQADFVAATLALQEVTTKLFNLTGEFGRGLNAAKRLAFTRKKITNLRKLYEEVGLENLNDPEEFYKFMAAIEEQMTARSGKKDPTAGEQLISVINIPRAIMSSTDLSAPLRQGIVFVGYPEFWKSFVKMFSMITPSGEGNYKFLMSKIGRDPNYKLMQKARIAFSSIDGELTTREEDFQTELARKIPGFGKIVKASEQAYAGFLNKLRADMFNRFVKEYRKAGLFDGTNVDEEGNLILTPAEEELMNGLGKFINSATGRAELTASISKDVLGKVGINVKEDLTIYDARRMSSFLNATFFSARLMQSRVNMLNPIFYANLPAPVRKQALKSMGAFGGIVLTVAGALATLFPDDIEVETDLRSSDFLKIKVGNTRFDIGGGFNQYLVLGARTVSWMYNNTLVFGERQLERVGVETGLSDEKITTKITASGNEKIYGEGTLNEKETFGGAVSDFLRSKLSPQLSLAVDNMVEEDFVGRPVTLEGSIASRLAPMLVTSMWQAYNEDSPVPLPAIAAVSLCGVGVNTYTTPDQDPKQKLESPDSFQMSDLEDGENDMIKAVDGEVTLKKEARDMWTATLNNYFPVFVTEVTLEEGYKSFDEAPSETKKKIIEEAKKRARKNAKEDMMIELGLEE